VEPANPSTSSRSPPRPRSRSSRYGTRLTRPGTTSRCPSSPNGTARSAAATISRVGAKERASTSRPPGSPSGPDLPKPFHLRGRSGSGPSGPRSTAGRTSRGRGDCRDLGSSGPPAASSAKRPTLTSRWEPPRRPPRPPALTTVDDRAVDRPVRAADSVEPDQVRCSPRSPRRGARRLQVDCPPPVSTAPAAS
jgi:hypothetical protein